MVLFYIIVVVVLIGIVSWIVEKTKKYLETRRYKEKLGELAPQLNAIDIEDWRKKLSRLVTAYSSVMDDLGEKYKVGRPKERVRAIEEYVEEEANYRRRRRKPAKRTYRRKNWRYRRY